MLYDEGLELLDDGDCLALLRSVPIGRVGVSVEALPAIFPVNFVLDGWDVVFRTGSGTKLAAAAEKAVVVFEADHFDAFEHTGWSVMAVGKAQAVTDGMEIARLSHLPLAPWAAGSRDHFVRIPIELMSGRRIGLERAEA